MCRGTDLGKTTKKISAAIKVLKSTVISIMLRSNRPPRAGHPTGLNN